MKSENIEKSNIEAGVATYYDDKANEVSGTVVINLSDDVCLSSTCNFDASPVCGERTEEYLSHIAEMIPSEAERSEFLSVFARDSLLSAFEQGKKEIRSEFILYNAAYDSYRYCSTAAALSEENGVVSAEITLSDDTSVYLASKIPSLIYQRRFCRVAVIDMHRRTISVEETGSGYSAKKWSKRVNYENFLHKSLERLVPANDVEPLFKKFSIKHLQERLAYDQRYIFNVRQLDDDGNRVIRRYSFAYLQKELGLILGTAEDVTDTYGRDYLTGGCNRDGFIWHVEELLADGRDRTNYAVLFFNINHFKAVNDLFGTDAGDRLLRGTFRRLSQSPILKPLVSARIESDHFLLFVEKKNLFPDNLTKICKRQFVENGKAMHLFARIGIYCLENDDVGVPGMIDRAKLAKSYITDQHVCPYAFFDERMRSSYVDQAEITTELDLAIRNEEFCVWFQPIVDTVTGRVASAEALVRWNHPTRGIISPGAFISAFENDGQISQLDRYVVKHVIDLQRDRYASNKRIVPISVNLSWMDFYDEEFMTWLHRRLSDSDVPKGYVRLEITETSYAALDNEKNDMINLFRENGARILLDDFGSGYSSLGTLQDHDFDIIKLDMSFIRRIGINSKTQSVLAAVIEMSHKLGLTIVAEGAETLEQISFLRENGCDYIQGFYFYRPITENAFTALLDEDERLPA